jgi:hypothetical protein
MLIRPVSGFGSLSTEFMRIGLSNRILSILDRNTRKTLTHENLVIIRVVLPSLYKERESKQVNCRVVLIQITYKQFHS